MNKTETYNQMTISRPITKESGTFVYAYLLTNFLFKYSVNKEGNIYTIELNYSLN